jgi:hypothetical protein
MLYIPKFKFIPIPIDVYEIDRLCIENPMVQDQLLYPSPPVEVPRTICSLEDLFVVLHDEDMLQIAINGVLAGPRFQCLGYI